MSSSLPGVSHEAPLSARGRLSAARGFHVAAGASMLAIMLIGFWPWYQSGRGMGGRQIDDAIAALVSIHGGFMSAWVVLFFVQALLVATRNQRIHRKLGWAAIFIGLGVTISGVLVAAESVRLSGEFTFWGMAYWQFLCIMLAEIAVFTAFLATGLLVRKRRIAHRAMMLLATLSILAGATVRMPVLFPLYGEAGWWGIFGPIFTLGAVFVLVHSLLLRSIDRWLLGGYLAMLAVYVLATLFAVSETWARWLGQPVGVG